MRVPPPRHALVAVVSLIATIFAGLAYREALVETIQSRWKSHETVPTFNSILIKDKVATITDTLFTPHLIPLILYYHAVLGPSWPIVFFTSQTTYDEHLSPNASSPSTSATWRRAVDAGSIETRIVSPEFNLTTRKGVNLYFSHPWLWEQLAPAKHVLVFQADAILCANAAQTVDDFLQYDFIGAPLNDTRKVYNGGLSLRNRTMLLEVLHGGNDWWKDWNTKGTEYGGHGEDYWMSVMMREKDANLPSIETALAFARQLPWHMDRPGRPVGYHRVYKEDRTRVPEARKWCPEIDLSSPGML
ncbi:conserved hypothetical protein [Verticillium alfalfae VaMs.102]|uniref:DUF5672 domain-containing protein n=1 Tax=Verticillium alfalfae (strain VaMs.102 / ATCC MYA-4576 / FGSC 10136) TaxID=526221 RepID=C9SRE7_VERA1|nr:conserved hypothetical protein [Verticillium alfalfae VaMs.102]EEY21362.1 conserved hypothetical protein [Verticillium alfalfae VaMs.102]